MSTIEKVATELTNLQESLNSISAADADTAATLHDGLNQLRDAMVRAREAFMTAVADAHDQADAEIDAAVKAFQTAIDSSATERAAYLSKTIGAPLEPKAPVQLDGSGVAPAAPDQIAAE